MINLSDKIID